MIALDIKPTTAVRGRPRITDARHFDALSLEEKIERWERVRYILRRMSQHVIDKHFDMSSWLSKTSCGTTGCVAGQCSLDPWFQRRGFGSRFEAHCLNGSTWNWTGLKPEEFFGRKGHREVFTNPLAMVCEVAVTSSGEVRERKPRAQHRIALHLTNKYLKTLKAQRET